jgi:hypothetical protein
MRVEVAGNGGPSGGDDVDVEDGEQQRRHAGPDHGEELRLGHHVHAIDSRSDIKLGQA